MARMLRTTNFRMFAALNTLLLVGLVQPKRSESIFDSKELDEIFDILNVNRSDVKQLEKYIRRAEKALKNIPEDKDGNINPAFIVNEFFEDPFPIKNFNISESGGFSTTNGHFSNMVLHGLKQLKIQHVKLNLGHMKINIVMDLPIVRLEGLYDINGQVTFFSFYGNGTFWMNVTKLEIEASSALDKTQNRTAIQVGSIDLDVRAKDINLHFDNLMGGGSWSSVTNTILNKMSTLIFNRVKHSMLEDVTHNMRAMINSHLNKLPLGFVDENSASIFDDLLDQANKALIEKGLDPLLLPPIKDKFNYNLLFLVIQGEIEIYNGLLYGLSTLVRTGDIIAKYDNNEATFEINMGFTNLTGVYKWSAHLMGGGPSGSASLSLSSISCHLKLRQKFRKGEPPTIEDFKVDQIKHLWVDVNGLGTWDFILEMIINLVSNAFKQSLANAISGPVKHAIQIELNQSPISLF